TPSGPSTASASSATARSSTSTCSGSARSSLTPPGSTRTTRGRTSSGPGLNTGRPRTATSTCTGSSWTTRPPSTRLPRRRRRPAEQPVLEPYTVHTLGFRYSGKLERNPKVLFDFENMVQLGEWKDGNSIVAGASSTGVGYNFSKAPMNPTVWAYFDWASGSRD